MKKYLLISEVADLLSIPMANLRYLEKTHPKIQIQKMRGRRYYKGSDIEKIADALGIEYKHQDYHSSERTNLPEAKKSTPSYTSKKPVVTTSVSLVKAPVHSVQEYKANLPMVEEKHELELYDAHLPMIAEKHELEAYDPHLPMIAEKHEIETYKENLPEIATKHEVTQLDLFAKIEPANHEKPVEVASVAPQKPQAQNVAQFDSTTLEQAKKRMEEIRDRLKTSLRGSA